MLRAVQWGFGEEGGLGRLLSSLCFVQGCVQKDVCKCPHGCQGGYKIKVSRIYSQDLKMEIFLKTLEDLGELNEIDYYPGIQDLIKQLKDNYDDDEEQDNEDPSLAIVAIASWRQRSMELNF
uniref:Uncharacterized protein n=1 Tax=Glossina pallidipes TaxID=7398 RepID=A0A1A9Z6D2_GLOPL